MAQHRSKEDKHAAQIHRMENMKLYSLKTIGDPIVATAEKPLADKLGINMTIVRNDLIRTFISTAIVLLLLAVGTMYLRRF